ncbi:MAG: RDD family protein [Rickettsiales bacterium]
MVKEDGFLRIFFLLYDPYKTHPWRRFWARWVDYSIWGFFLFSALVFFILNSGLVFPEYLDNRVFLSISIVTTWVIIEPFFIALWGSTPGKWMLGVKVLRIEGNKLSLSESVLRSIQVWLKGLAIGFPLFNLFAMARARTKLVNEGSTSWDTPKGNQVFISKPSWLGIVMLVLWLTFYIYMATLR